MENDIPKSHSIMSAPSPSVFRQTIQLCGEQDGGEVFECLQSSLGVNNGFYRTLPEVLIRLFGVHVIALASYGHMMSTQGYACAGSLKPAVLLIVFIVLPDTHGAGRSALSPVTQQVDKHLRTACGYCPGCL